MVYVNSRQAEIKKRKGTKMVMGVHASNPQNKSHDPHWRIYSKRAKGENRPRAISLNRNPQTMIQSGSQPQSTKINQECSQKPIITLRSEQNQLPSQSEIVAGQSRARMDQRRDDGEEIQIGTHNHELLKGVAASAPENQMEGGACVQAKTKI